MATKQVGAAQQLSLDELFEVLDERPGELVPLPLDPDDIGAGLLDILSKGLYTNPFDCIREYVQNGVDADASEVTIKITGNSVMIFDDGAGMNLEELVQARQFGLSNKSLAEYVGFRGIGIYSGFDLSRKLRITSKKAGDRNLHVLVFDFAAMKAQLEASKQRNMRKPSLLRLLSEHTFVKRDIGNFDEERHFTQVELQDISDVHIRHLSNRAEFKRYLLQNLPVDFADGFDHRRIITEKLRTHVPGYKAVKIVLQSDGLQDDVVVKEAVGDLQEPSYGYIKTSSDQQVAYYWACLHSDRGRIQPTPRDGNYDGGSTPEGFVYKVKGFTIGDRHKLRQMFRRKPQLYNWYTGEIYVLDTNVIPNAERDDFETNQAKRALELAVLDKLGELEAEAERFQAEGVADERVDKYKDEVVAIADQVASNTQDNDFKTYARLDTILKDLKRQKNKTSANKRGEAEDLLKRVERLQKQLRREVDTPTPEAARRKRVARDESSTGGVSVRGVEPPPPTSAKTLRSVLQDSAWELEGETLRLVELIQGSLEDVLTFGSPAYCSLMDDIEGKLSSSNADE